MSEDQQKSKSTIVNVVRFLDQELSNNKTIKAKKNLLASAKINLSAAYKLTDEDIESTPHVDLPKQAKTAIKLEEWFYGNRVASDFSTLGKKAFLKRNIRLTLSNFSKAIRYNSKNPAYWCDRAEAYHNVGAMRLAMKDCQRALHLKPHCARAYNRMGLIYFSMDKKMDGLKSCRTAVMYEPTNKEYRINYRLLREVYIADIEQVPLKFTQGFDDPVATALLQSGVDIDLLPYTSYSDSDDSSDDEPYLDDGSDVNPSEPRIFYLNNRLI